MSDIDKGPAPTGAPDGHAQFKIQQEWEKWLRVVTNPPLVEIPAELEMTLSLKLPWQTWLFVTRAAINQDCLVDQIIRNALVNSEDIEDWGNEDKKEAKAGTEGGAE